MNKPLLHYIKKLPSYIFLRLLFFLSPVLPDKLYLFVLFRLKMGYWMDFKEPVTFSEKLQWLKLYDRRPEYTMMVDKAAVKDYVSSLIGSQYVIPTLGIWERPEDIDWESLPERFVLKTTHSGGSTGVVICVDKNSFDRKSAIDKLNKSLNQNTYHDLKEWPYKNVPRRIIAEKYLEDNSGELKDYKVFNFNGEPRMIQVDYNRFQGHLRNLYTLDWKRIDATIGYPTDLQRDFPKPQVLDEIIDLSRKLSKGIPHVRTDFYIVNCKVYFGELTFYHGSGYEKTTPGSFNKQIGDWLMLPMVEAS